jgi:hypothetical protein
MNRTSIFPESSLKKFLSNILLIGVKWEPETGERIFQSSVRKVIHPMTAYSFQSLKARWDPRKPAAPVIRTWTILCPSSFWEMTPFCHSIVKRPSSRRP